MVSKIFHNCHPICVVFFPRKKIVTLFKLHSLDETLSYTDKCPLPQKRSAHTMRNQIISNNKPKIITTTVNDRNHLTKVVKSICISTYYSLNKKLCLIYISSK